MPQGFCGNPRTHARCSRASSADSGIFAALKRYPRKDRTASPLPTATPTWPPQTPAQPGPLQGKPRHRGEGRIFQGHAQGLRQGRLQERERHHRRASRQGELLGKAKSPPWQRLGCCCGAAPWEGGIPSNPSHPSLPHPPGNLNPGFSRAASTGATGYKKSSSLPSLAPWTTGTNKNNIIKVASTQPSLGAGFGWQRGSRRGGTPRADPGVTPSLPCRTNPGCPAPDLYF